VFDEAHLSAAQKDRVISSGWASTVGVVGWAIGGGHGPFAPSKGLGVDNILELDIITANGTFLTANAVNNTDLYWALRGGGGGNWGIITAITYRAH
jgi:ribonuclease T2